jgi:hypothetical protein
VKGGERMEVALSMNEVNLIALKIMENFDQFRIKSDDPNKPCTFDADEIAEQLNVDSSLVFEAFNFLSLWDLKPDCCKGCQICQ